MRVPFFEILYRYPVGRGDAVAGVALFDKVEAVAVVDHSWLRRRGGGDACKGIRLAILDHSQVKH